MAPSAAGRPLESLATISIGGIFSFVVFVGALFAFVIESVLTQYVQTTLNYRQSFFLFYVVHSAFALIFPIHLLYLVITTGRSASSYMRGLSMAISNHLAPERKYAGAALGFPLAEFLRLTLALTAGISIPSVLWFISMSLSPLTDVTAIANTTAFWSYLISVKLFKLKWQPKRLLAVLCATLGTMAVIYGGAKATKPIQENDVNIPSLTDLSPKPSAPLIGNLCILFAAFAGGLYQVLYKIYATLPTDPENAPEHAYDRIPDEEIDPHSEIEDIQSSLLPSTYPDEDAVYPPPFGLHPNLITSVLGFFTFAILWIPLAVLHWTGVEPFRLPPDGLTWLVVGGVSLCGVMYNGGVMVLLGVWGPIIVSVGNLLTIVLVLVIDVLFGSGLHVLTMWSLIGAGSIVLAFGVLSYDMFANDTS